jgi:hypothetical protein
MQLSFKGGFWGKLQVWLVAVMVFLLLPAAVFAADPAPAGAAAPAPEAAPVAAVAPETPAVVGSGDYKAGLALFTGQRAFKNGGPPCISCHNAGVGALGGGSLGPDLTKVWVDKSFLIDAGWINSDGIPVMGAIFSKKNVTPEEVADLQTFFHQQSTMSAAAGSGKFVLGGIIAFVIFIIIIAAGWSGRYRNRCQGTAHDALWRNYAGKGGK